MLHDNRHDVFVRVKMREIELALDQEIAKLEQQEKEQQKKDQQKQQKQQKQDRLTSQMQSQPKQNSELGQPSPSDSAKGSAQVAGKSSTWSQLPPASRDEILQSYATEMPPKWRKRLEAYFYSIAVEEAKKDRR